MKSEKITEKSGARERWYEDACAVAHALDLVGERWALLVMRELMFGSKRFGELRESLPGISANVLTQRLEGLEGAGVLVRRKLPPPASAQVYELTPWGLESEPIFQALGRWGACSPAHETNLPFSATSLFLSFRTMLDPARAKGLRARIGFKLGEERFCIDIADGRIQVARGEPDGADVVLTAMPPVIAGIVYAGLPIEAMEASGALKVDGDRALAARFTSLFPLPAKAVR